MAKQHPTTDSKSTSNVPSWVMESGVESSFRQQYYAVAIIEVSRPSQSNENVITKVGLYANPTDQQCHRLIARVLVDGPQDMMTRLNQMHSLEDSLAVSTAVAAVKQVLWHRKGLFVQSLHLGNNSMRQRSTTITTGTSSTNDESVSAAVQLGTDHEAYFYHDHLICRGNPEQSYFDNVPALGGPPLGTAFAAQGAHTRPNRKDILALVKGMKDVLGQDDEDWLRAACNIEIV